METTQFASTTRLELRPGCVDVWNVPLTTSLNTIDTLQQILSTEERARAARFRSQTHRDLFTVGRAVLRTVLSRYVDEHPGRFEFHLGSKGKPHLLDCPSIRFNLAHSCDHAVYAISTEDVGIDIEWIKPMPNWKRFSRRFFSPREVEELEELQPEDRATGFFSCWTRKEAYLKAMGDGITVALNKFYVGANPSAEKGEIQEDGKPVEWFFQDLRLDEGYVGALVTRLVEPELRVMRLANMEEFLRFWPPSPAAEFNNH